ncbi:MAG: hypothetical protein L0215_22785 [Gemmataceae bacterium]|nr:hypothetical protein [Gemmataceae bacterium]
MRFILTVMLALVLGGYTYLAGGWMENEARAVSPEVAGTIRGGECYVYGTCPKDSKCDRRCDHDPNTGCVKFVYRDPLVVDNKNGFKLDTPMCQDEPDCLYAIVGTLKCDGIGTDIEIVP